MARDVYFTSLYFASVDFLMESVVDPWGEDDLMLNTCIKGEFNKMVTLSRWAYLAQSAEPGDLLLDVGSYSGLFSLVAAKLNPLIKIAAFEAAVVTYARLIRNITLNGLEASICPAHFAAWHEATTLDLIHPHGIYSMFPGNSAAWSRPDPDHIEKVIAIPLDGMLDIEAELPGALGSLSLGVKTFTGIPAIRLSVCGAEDRALLGTTQILRFQRPHILCELLTKDIVSNVSKFVAEYDYLVKPLGEGRDFHLVPYEKQASFEAAYEEWQASRKPELTLNAERKLVFPIA